LKLIDSRRDYYRKKARKEGYRSRAAYKLKQLDDVNKILFMGAAIIDFGAAPGGWMQVASERVGTTGFVLGIDLNSIESIDDNAISIEKDVMDTDILEVIKEKFPRRVDAVISDIAPNITGIWQIDHLRQNDLVLRIVTLLPDLLRPGGSALFKIFEGEESNNIYKNLKKVFSKIIIAKPPASRNKSSELYYVCKKYKIP
jgi:23S rRNA (uridine2552-2'-O)-methyltransferase